MKFTLANITLKTIQAKSPEKITRERLKKYRQEQRQRKKAIMRQRYLIQDEITGTAKSGRSQLTMYGIFPENVEWLSYLHFNVKGFQAEPFEHDAGCTIFW